MKGNGNDDVVDDQNIVLVTADSFRADHCGFLGSDSDLTPTLDALADEGVVFENAISPGPRTLTSVPEMLTGEVLPHVSPDSYSEHVSRFSDHVRAHQTLPERLSSAGYTTIAFSANPWTSTRCGVDETFDEFYDIGTLKSSLVGEVSSSFLSGTKAESIALWAERWRQNRSFFSQWSSFFDQLRETLTDAPEPYFLWVFLLDTHNPYIVPPRDRIENSTPEMYYGVLRSNGLISHSSGFSTSNFKSQLSPHVETLVERAYRDAVRSVDRFVASLLAEIGDEDPLVVFNADHGEAFNEHGTYGHQQALYEENVHVPLLFYGSSDDDAQRVSRPISLRVLPQLLESYARDGTPVTSDEWTDSSVVARSEDASKIAVRTADRKYITAEDGDEFYDLSADPDERRNVADDAETDRFERRIEKYLEQVPERETTANGDELPRDVRQRLSMLGYSDGTSNDE